MGKYVKISHIRRYFKYDPKTGKKLIRLLSYEDHKDIFPDFFLDAKGGETHLSISTIDNPSDEASFIVECSNKDPYNRRIGVSIGIGRYIKSL